MSEFMGINFHTVLVHDASVYAQTCRLARDYHPVSWDISHGQTKLPYAPVSQNGVNWDSVYGKWKNAGFRINASLCFLDDHFISAPNTTFSTNAKKELVAYGESFARSFGPGGKWPLVESVEVENEPHHSNDQQYAELFQSLTTGIRKGNKKIEIATCAVTADQPSPSEFDKSIEILEGKENFFDVISMHTYALKSGWPAFEGSYPEDASTDYLGKIERMIEYRNHHPALQSKQIWITEFGFDAGSEVAQKRHPQWISSTETEQAIWIVRSFLLFSGMDIRRAYLYWFEDDDAGDFHGASGIIRKDRTSNTHQPKPSFYAMRHLYHALGNYRFNRIVTHHHNGTFIYEFTDDSNHIAWVIWSGSKGKPDHLERITDLPTRKLRVVTLSLSDKPVTSTLSTLRDNNFALTVGEIPRFIFFE
jgi:hypothetical protein